MFGICSKDKSSQKLLLFLFVVAATVTCLNTASAASSPEDVTTFQLKPNLPFVNCMAQHPDDPAHQPTAVAKITRGQLADTLTVTLSNFKPNVEFALFTVQKSNLKANASVDPTFKNFGFAWYQSDVLVGPNGTAQVAVSLKTILLDQIFGFDPAAKINPVHTFHLGFWFDNPADAAACGFTGSTPFNGEHNAGPVAMISVPNGATNLGPLCLNVNTSTHPATCNP